MWSDELENEVEAEFEGFQEAAIADKEAFEDVMLATRRDYFRALWVERKTRLNAKRRAKNAANPRKNGGALNAQKTHCPKGHAYAGENLYVNSEGKRFCKSCRNASANAAHKKARESK